jgi:hypothetical protein
MVRASLWPMLVMAAACTRGVPASSPPPGGATQQLTMAASGHLLLTARIDGRPHVMVLDTGANITSLSTRAAKELAIETTGSMRINDSIVAPTGKVRKLAISGVDHDDVAITIVDIPDALATGADGIVGLDVLGRHDIVVDLARDELGLYPAGTLAKHPRERIAFDYGANGLILLDIELDNRTSVPAMLDLGAPVSVLNRSAGALIGARGPATMVARTGNTTLGPVRVLVRDLGTFARLGLATRPAIVLGNDVFEDRVLSISYRDRLAFVSPPRARRYRSSSTTSLVEPRAVR